LEIQSGSIRHNLTSFTQSQELKNSRYEASQSAAIISASLFNDVSSSYVISASSLGIKDAKMTPETLQSILTTLEGGNTAPKQ
jgi:hypothetical protein